MSKRQCRLAQIDNPGADERARGDVIRGLDGTFLWWNDEGQADDETKGVWHEAVYHNDIRGQLLAAADENGREVYDFPRRQGVDPFDKTAFLASQKNWHGEDKNFWSTIADNISNRFEPKGHKNPDYEIPFMHYNDKIVLDHDNHPIRLFKDLPLTLSSTLEPWLLEAITRVDRRIFKVDFRARMPATFTNQYGKVQNICGLAALGNKALRFREIYGLIAWTTRTGSDVWKQKVLKVMTEEQIANNTTVGLPKFPTRGRPKLRRVKSPKKTSKELQIIQWDSQKTQDSRIQKSKKPNKVDLNVASLQSSDMTSTQKQIGIGRTHGLPSLSQEIDAQKLLQAQYIAAMRQADQDHMIESQWTE